MKSKRLLSKTLRANVENVLKRRAIPYIVVEENDALYCLSDLSGADFHKIIVRAKMEKETEEIKSEIPFISKMELNDWQVLEEIGEVHLIHE